MNYLRLCISLLIFIVIAGCSMPVKDSRKEPIMDDSIKELKESEYAMPAAPSEKPKKKAAHKPSSSGLKAGYADDNKQFNYFLSFLKKYEKDVIHYPVDISERILIRVRDKDNHPVANAEVGIYDNDVILCSGKTYADGTFLFFPSEYGDKITTYRTVVAVPNGKMELMIDRQGMREISILMDMPRTVEQNIPLDLLFIMDTTGSMGEEINRLKNTIEIINLNLASLSTKPRIRFGMVLFRDRNDEYTTKIIDFTDDLDKFSTELNKVTAFGGGDAPEDMQSAMLAALTKMKWNDNGIRIGYLITDAPPHLNYNQEYTYINAVHDARKAGIKIFTVGTGGLNLMGEYILRQISQYTYAKYIFLTYGEKDESEGGKEGSVSHHTGANFQTDKLESIIIRFAKEELSFISDQPLPEDDSYFQAIKALDETNEDILQKLFDMSISQLVDYSSINIEKGASVSVIPFTSENRSIGSDAEYFTEQMALSLAKNKAFRMLERRDMQKIMEELKLQYSGIVDEKSAVKAGSLLGAKMIITGRLYLKNDAYEIFMKLLRVETGETLSVNKVKIAGNLGLNK